MSLEVVEVTTKKQSKEFINFPWKIYKGDPNWVPPLKIAERDRFDPKHPFFQTATMRRFLAIRDGETVGRIAAIHNREHNRFHEEKCGHFGFFETINDLSVAKALLEVAEKYLKDDGLTLIRGPMNPSTNYECGLLVKGVDDPPQIMMTYNPPYYEKLLLDLGYVSAKNLLAYRIDASSDIPEKIVRISDRVKKAQHITCRPLNLKNWEAEIDTLYDIYNNAWEKNWGFIPYTEAEFRQMTKELKPLCMPELALLMLVRERPVGIMVALPDYYQILKKIPNGRLFPFGLFKLLTGRKKITRARVLIMGIKKEFRTMGLSTLFYTEICQAFRKLPQFKEVEMSWILEDNYAMNHPLQVMNAEPYKTYRIYEKGL